MSLKAKQAAINLLSKFGIDNPNKVEIVDIAHALDISITYSDLQNSEGRIVHGTTKSMVVLNKNCKYSTRSNFTIAHEIGHFILHKDEPIIHDDKVSGMSWFNPKYSSKIAKQEYEANCFASELLLPESIFRNEVEGKAFSPDIIRYLSGNYKISRSAVIFKFTELDFHPVCVFYSHQSRVKFWKKSTSFRYKIKDCTKLPPPSDSVATEYFEEGIIYPLEE